MVLKRELFLNFIFFFASSVETVGLLRVNGAKYSHRLNKMDVVDIIRSQKFKLYATLDSIIFTLSSRPSWEATRTSLHIMSSFLKYFRSDLS